MDVEITHPAYVRHAPRGSRLLRDALARVVTPATLREAAPSRLEHPAQVVIETQPHSGMSRDLRKRNSFDLAAHDGQLYAPLTYTDGYAGPTELLLPDFLRYLAGDAHGSRLDGLVAAFRGTPIQDLSHLRSLHGGHEDGRGMPYDPERQREVAHDGRAEAAQRLRAFLDSEILVSGDKVLRRFRPLAQRIQYGVDWIVPMLGSSTPLWEPPAVALDRLDDGTALNGVNDARALGREAPVTDAARQEAARLLALDPGLAGSQRDIEIGVAEVAGEAARWLHGAIRDGDGDKETLRTLAEGFAPFHMRLRIGALPAIDLPEAQRWTRQVVGFVSANCTPRGAFGQRVGRAAAYLDLIVAPRLQALAPMAEEDLAALEGLRL